MIPTSAHDPKKLNVPKWCVMLLIYRPPWDNPWRPSLIYGKPEWTLRHIKTMSSYWLHIWAFHPEGPSSREKLDSTGQNLHYLFSPTIKTDKSHQETDRIHAISSSKWSKSDVSILEIAINLQGVSGRRWYGLYDQVLRLTHKALFCTSRITHKPAMEIERDGGQIWVF